MAKRLLSVALVASLTACSAEQGKAQAPSLQPSSAVAVAPSQLEAQGYKVVGVAVDDPFTFLPFIEKRRATLVAHLDALLLNQPYTLDRARTQALQLIAQSGLTPTGESNFQLLIQSLQIEDVNAQASTLRLRYRILSVAPPFGLGGAVESQRTAQISPQRVAGVSQMHHNFGFLPLAAYNRASGFLAGGSFYATPTGRTSKFIRTAFISGVGSHNTRAVDVALTGSTHSPGILTDTNWHLDYTSNAAPVRASSVASASLSAQFNTQTRPFWNESTFFRTGFLIEGGNRQGRLSSAVLPATTIANTGAGSLRIYEGLSQFSSHNVLSLSYGLELGSTHPAAGIDWRKHVAEVTSDFWWNLRDHAPLELESSFNVGTLQVPKAVPLAERFFGGNVEHFFIPNDTWQIRDQPFIRAIPANQLSNTPQGLGSDSFAAVNLTLSYPFFKRPLVSRDVTSDPAVQTAIHGALISSQSLEQVYYQFKDPHFTSAAALVPAIQVSLAQLQTDFSAAHTASSDAALDFDDCSDAIGDALTMVHNAQSGKGSTQYGRVTSLTNFTPNDDDSLGAVQQTCGDGLNVSLKNPILAADLTAIAGQRTALLSSLAQIDIPAAQKKASADLSLARKTLNTLFTQVNIVSVAPVAILDTARIGPVNPQSGGTRIGPGGGVRLELASSVDFTLGYAANIFRKPGEDHGAVFFAIRFRDLFR